MLNITALLPWWIGVMLAVVAYFVMHWLATPEVAVAGASRSPGATVGSSVARGLAAAGQYLLPLVFLIGSVVSFFRDPRRRQIDTESRDGAEVNRERMVLPTGAHTLSREHDLYPEWKEVGQGDLEPKNVDTSRWSLEVLNALEWKRFENLCAAYFEELGFRAKTVRAGPDGGVDIHLYAEGDSHPGMIVQCKAWRTRMVGVSLIRELFGVMTAGKVAEGIFATTGGFSDDANGFARGKNIHLINGEDFLAKLLALPPERQQALLKLATEGDFTTPTCASCGVKMVFRTPKAGGNPFWGCRNYPRCTTKMQVAKSQ
jgi:restriction system protein